MNKELKTLEVRKQELINKLNTDFEDDIYGTYRQLLQLKVENINLQIQIYNLMQPAIQKKLLEPMPPIYISKETPPTADEVVKGNVEHAYYSDFAKKDITYVANSYSKAKLKRIRLLMTEVMREVEKGE